jgi:hypothetical protein
MNVTQHPRLLARLAGGRAWGRRLAAMCAALTALSGCYSYSKIDSKHWIEFKDTVDGRTLEYSVPDSFVVGQPRAWPGATSVRSFFYDVLSGPTIYGVAEETAVEFLLAESPETSAEAFARATFTSRPASESGYFKPDWYLYVVEWRDGGGLTRAYVNGPHDGKFLVLRATLSGEVFQKEELRKSRAQLADDIMKTVVVR